MIYFYADLLYKNRVFRILKAENNSDKAINEILKRQDAIQAQDSSVITLFRVLGNYQHTKLSQADKELTLEFLSMGQIPPYSTLVWAQTFLEKAG